MDKYEIFELTKEEITVSSMLEHSTVDCILNEFQNGCISEYNII